METFVNYVTLFYDITLMKQFMLTYTTKAVTDEVYTIVVLRIFPRGKNSLD